MTLKNADETISKTDSIIRILSKSTPHGNLLDANDIKIINGMEEDDKPRLAERLEDLIILLKDEPDNRRKLTESCDTLMTEFGNLLPVADVLRSVNTFFLSK